MPPIVVLAAGLQLLLALTFVICPVVAHRYGEAAQRAAEAAVVRQGVPAEILAEQGIWLRQRTWETMLALTVAAVLTTLGVLNLAGIATGRILSWIFEPIVLVMVGVITASQIFAGQYIEAALVRSEDSRARSLDARAVVVASGAAWPVWLHAVIITRFGLTTVGSLAVSVALVTPGASTYFH